MLSVHIRISLKSLYFKLSQHPSSIYFFSRSLLLFASCISALLTTLAIRASISFYIGLSLRHSLLVANSPVHAVVLLAMVNLGAPLHRRSRLSPDISSPQTNGDQHRILTPPIVLLAVTSSDTHHQQWFQTPCLEGVWSLPCSDLCHEQCYLTLETYKSQGRDIGG